VLEQRQAALLQARDDALGASRAKDEFLAALSHELRTPLNPVLLLASDAAHDPEYPAAVRELFATIEKNVMQEVRLIDDLLDITRIVAGKISLRKELVCFDAAVREAVEVVGPSAVEKRLRVELALGAEGVMVLADSVRLQQVFTNLLGNAVKFTPEGGTLQVRTQVDRATRGVDLEIIDSGIGMTAQELLRVFERFAQGDHARSARHSRYGGLGLGLTISRSLVESHGGRIAAMSPGPGAGSTFRVWLPLSRERPEGS
jgi:signal transduction histidine kinase